MGGSACGVRDGDPEGRQRCERMDTAVEFKPHSLEPALDKWVVVQGKKMIVSR